MPEVLGLIGNPLFESYGTCWAKRYLPLDHKSFRDVERELMKLILGACHDDEEMWIETIAVLRRHLRSCVELGIQEHLPRYLHRSAFADLAREDFKRVMPSMSLE